MKLQEAPYRHTEFIDKTNVALGVDTAGEYARLTSAQRGHIGRRIAEWRLVDPDTLNEASAREMFMEARRIVALLLSDHHARCPWWLRMLGWK